MKKLLLLTLVTPLLFSITGCKQNTPSSEISSSESEIIDFAPIDQEIKGTYEYFKLTTNYTEGSDGYGLTQDRLTKTAYSSIAATGFLLGCYPVFVEQGYMNKEETATIVDKTFDTILRMQADSSTSYGGCISHFVGKTTAKRYENSEVSTIDTAILVSGVITAAQYFGGELIDKGNTIWGNVDFTKFKVTSAAGAACISMGVDNPSASSPKQLSPWDYYAEQLMIYILGVGNPVPEHRISSLYYKSMLKNKGTYGDITHIYSWYGSIFTYQYSHAFFNFRDYKDAKGNNYFENSVNASKTNYLFCKSLKDNYKTFQEDAWGLTACDTPLGYSGLLGARPRGWGGNNDIQYLYIQGTVAPTGAISSMPFTPEESYRALVYYQSLEKLCDSKFGLRDAYNLDFNGAAWYDPDMIGIDKGIAAMQLYNYKVKDFISNLAMSNEYVILGFENNGFTKA